MLGLWVDPIYYARGYHGALRSVWVRVQLAQRLPRAVTQVLAEDHALLLCDGWRSRELQQTLWHEHGALMSQRTGLAGEELDRRLRDFVAAPGDADPPPPHTTGGAIDVTLCTLDGQPIDMGGDFAELSERSHAAYYEQGQPSAEDLRYRDRRRVLLRAMTEAGFWQLPTEWWHFEYGTAAWATQLGGRALFDEAPAPPN
jgi:zinc D-Ala-D-Ala dipeptidase